MIGDGVLMAGVGTPGAGGSFQGHILIQRTATTLQKKYNLLSSPIVGATTRNLDGPDTRTYLAGSQTWSGLMAITDVLQQGVGYTTSGSANGQGGPGTKQFSGAPGDGLIDVPLVVNPGVNDDWNLLGNPYPSSISGNKFLADNASNIAGAVYFWSNDTAKLTKKNSFVASDFIVNNALTGDFAIPVAQGFFVEATGANISFTNQQRSTANLSLYRTKSKNALTYIRLSQENGEENNLIIGFSDQATDGYDQMYDARKMKGNEAMSFYSLLEDRDCAIQGLGELSAQKTVALGMDLATQGMAPFRISLDAVEQLDPNVRIVIEDLQQNSLHDLTKEDYVFTENKRGRITNRFVLHYIPMLTRVDQKPSSLDLLKIYSIGQQIILEGDNTGVSAVRIMDMQGRIVYQVLKPQGDNRVEINTDLEDGSYIVEAISQSGNKTMKVVLKR
jgi:hypothetical protein